MIVCVRVCVIERVGDGTMESAAYMGVQAYVYVHVCVCAFLTWHINSPITVWQIQYETQSEPDLLDIRYEFSPWIPHIHTPTHTHTQSLKCSVV